jgi:hypothetical protein
MTDVGYVIAGWMITAVVVAGYWGSVLWRTRRAQRAGVQAERADR